MGDLLAGLTITAALACGVMAGFYFAFSSLVMPSLARQPPDQAISAMQRINLVVINPLFMLFFLGSALGSAALAVAGFVDLDEDYAGYLIAGGVLMVVGSLLMTMAYHQPRNLRLGEIDPAAPASEAHWRRYLAQWVPWNTVRFVASLAAAALLTVAVRV